MHRGEAADSRTELEKEWERANKVTLQALCRIPEYLTSFEIRQLS